MKKAVIVVGSHHVGKSRTINSHLKPLLKMRPKAWLFLLGEKSGCVLSKSFEESRRDARILILKYSNRELLVLAARPANETSSQLREIRKILTDTGFVVSEVAIIHSKAASYYEQRAVEVFDILKSK